MDDELNFLNLVRHETAVTALVPGQFLFQKGDDAQAMYVVKDRGKNGVALAVQAIAGKGKS